MKKGLLILAALLAVVSAALYAVPWGLPQPAQLEHAAVAGTDGLTYVIENGPVYSRIYGVDESGQLVRYYREGNALGTASITQLSWGGDGLYFLRESYDDNHRLRWEAVRLDADGVVETLAAFQPKDHRATGFTAPTYVAAVTADGRGGVTLFDVNGGAQLLTHPTEDGFRALSAQYLSGESMLVLLDDGRQVQWDRAGVREVPGIPQPPPLPETIQVSYALRATCKIPLLLTGIGATAALWLFLVLIARLLSKSKRLAVRVVAASGGSLLLALCIMSGALLAQSASVRLSDRLGETQRLTRQFAATAASLEPAAVLHDGFYRSPNRAVLTELLADAGADLFALREDAPVVAVSDRLPYGASPDAAIAHLVHTAQGGTPVSALLTLQGRQTAVSAYPVLSAGVPVAVMTVQSDAGDIVTAALRALLTLVLTGLTVAVLACGALALFLWRVTRPLGQLTRQMVAVSDGDTKVRDIRTGLDELGDMAHAMQDLCMNLSIREYEVQSTLESYHRFAPRGLIQLLDRASVMEVGFGDAASLSGVVGILSVSNRLDVRTRLEDTDFVDFINRCYSAVEESTTTHGGYLLSPGFDLSGVRLYYPGKASAAVASGLQLLGDAQAEGDDDAPVFALILHSATVLYGLAGSKEKLFPFLSSQETEFLTSYANRFAETGARLVLTHNFLRDLEPGYATRYIGFVSAPDTGLSYKLYEVLDCYSDIERNLRIRYDDRFQEAIQLFYHSDFYLARNLFSTLLRACPSDGIARWYLFACEHYFNSVAPAGETECQLFGVEA